MRGNMQQLFITELKIEKVRHLRDIKIPLERDFRKHLILTGCNGSGKTSVLEDLAGHLNGIATAAEEIEQAEGHIKLYESKLKKLREQGKRDGETVKAEENFVFWNDRLLSLRGGVSVEMNRPVGEMRYAFDKGEFVLGYYGAERTFQVSVTKHIEKVELKGNYAITENTRQEFMKYLADCQVTAALAKNRGDMEKADKINSWFLSLLELLKKIYDDESLQLIFDEDSYNFKIKQKGREDFDFNTMSSGFSAVWDIISDLILKMEKITERSFIFDVPGIVLIDEIETHLHLKMQKNIMNILTTVFPNVQFIVSTHSPFILNSGENAVIFDLEKQILVRDGLSNVPYGGVVEGYFNASELSHDLDKKFKRFRELTGQESLSVEELEEIADLEFYLDEIPDYLALNLTTEYQRLKLKFEKREEKV